MMRTCVMAVCLALSACTWSNSLYHARRLSDEALSLEKNDRPFEAVNVWSRAAVVADTSYSRDPDGRKGAEALWLRGRARARSGDCEGGVSSLEAALGAAPAAPWRETLELELGRCLDRLGDPRAIRFFVGLQSSSDPDVRRAARLSAGRSYIDARQWESALTMLEGIDTSSARMDRAIALAALGRSDAVWTELDPLLAEPDTVRNWSDVVEAFAASDRLITDSLLARLEADGSAVGARRSTLLYAAARGALRGDATVADARLDALVATNDPSLSAEGKLLVATRLLANATSGETLRSAVDSFSVLSTDDGATVGRFAALGRIAERVRAQHDSLVPGSPQGDMLTFLHGEAVRDSLHAPALADYFFARIERDWPTSPYVPKALIARMVLTPDSADAIRGRLLTYTDSPYLAYLEGRETGLFADLEFALLTFAVNHRARTGAPVRPRANPDDVPAGGVGIP